MELAGALEQLVDEESRPALALLLDELVERGDPLRGLLRIDVRKLVLELVEVHRALVSGSGGFEPERGLEDLRRGHRFCRRITAVFAAEAGARPLDRIRVGR